MITKELARKFRRFIELMSENATDEEALENIVAFPKWKAETEYVANDRIRFNDVLYKVLQNHTSQETWTPDVTPSLYVRVDNPQEEWPEWRQPLGSTDAYPLGAKVSWPKDERRWVSLVDGNVWEPSDNVPTLWESHD